MHPLHRLDTRLTATAQPQTEDFAALAAQGFRAVINARPDGEDPGQPGSAEMERAARAAGLEYRHLPVRLPALGEADVDAFAAAVAELPGPVLGFCRSGTRVAALWAWTQARAGHADAALGTVQAAGFDLGPVHARIARVG